MAFPDDDGGIDLLWRFWLPEGALERLDRIHNGSIRRWAEQGWLTITPGDVLDYQQVYRDIEVDAEAFTILGVDADAWSAAPVIQEIESRTDIEEIYAYKNDYTHMSPGMRTIMDLVKKHHFRWHGNPVARWCFDSVEARVAPYDPDIIRPSKPNRGVDAKRIDGVPTAIMAVNAWTTRGDLVEEEFEFDGFSVY
jgi:phage terminase large subunit-like protein